jgi:hypothetical protein
MAAKSSTLTVDAGIEVLILKILTYKKYSVNNTSTPSRMYDRL